MNELLSSMTQQDWTIFLLALAVWCFAGGLIFGLLVKLFEFPSYIMVLLIGGFFFWLFTGAIFCAGLLPGLALG